ncbi:MAG: ECF-type sigma factor [Planctomycetota bacterium]
MPDTPGPARGDGAADATMLLRRVESGDTRAADELLPLVYGELRERAAAYFRGQSKDHTLQPTALVHEAFAKLVRAPDTAWQSRAHFCSVAALAMRQVLTDHARRRAAARRGEREGVTELATPAAHATIDLLALDEALTELAALNPRHARLVELRFFGGLNNPEVAEVLGLSTSMVEKEWRKVRAWLSRALGGDGAT